jgi:hypothetical protein
MKYFQKIAEVDVAALNAQLEGAPELWGQFGWRKTIAGGPHAQMSDIWVRYNAPERIGKPGFTDEHDSVWYPAYARLPALKDIIYPLMCVVEGERLGGVLITRIPPAGGIAPHVDGGWHVEYYDKFYVSLKSAPGADFCCGEERLNPRAGEIWRFDNRLRHWVENKSAEDRMTLIVCIRTHRYQNHGERHAAAA